MAAISAILIILGIAHSLRAHPILEEFPGDIEPFSLKEPTEVSTRGQRSEVKGGQLRRKRSIASRRLFFQQRWGEDPWSLSLGNPCRFVRLYCLWIILANS